MYQYTQYDHIISWKRDFLCFAECAMAVTASRWGGSSASNNLAFSPTFHNFKQWSRLPLNKSSGPNVSRVKMAAECACSIINNCSSVSEHHRRIYSFVDLFSIRSFFYIGYNMHYMHYNICNTKLYALVRTICCLYAIGPVQYLG